MNRSLNYPERKSCYQILAALFSYPETELLEPLERFLAELSTLLGLPLSAELKNTPALLDLEVAYTGLFINRLGGAPAPPYGSVYLDADGQLMGESCLRVADSYRREGLNLDGSDEPADFLATELEFIYYLITAEQSAVAVGDRAAAASWKQKQADFCRELLHPWLAIFCQRLKGSAGGHPLYQWLASALERFSELEQQQFSRQLEPAENS